jgi:hypothetical protein
VSKAHGLKSQLDTTDEYQYFLELSICMVEKAHVSIVVATKAVAMVGNSVWHIAWLR